ncbi:hypothetical protein ACTXQV_80120, partial [Klebsiella pneumoniae]
LLGSEIITRPYLTLGMISWAILLALDLGNQQVVLQLIGDLAHRQVRTVLFTTHDPNHALQVASHTLLLLP